VRAFFLLWLEESISGELVKEEHPLINSFIPTFTVIWYTVSSRQKNTDSPSGAISPNGQIFAGGYENGVIKLWTLPTAQLLYTFVGYQSSNYALIFSSDGHQIVSMGSDHTSNKGYVKVSDPAAIIKFWELDGLA